MTLEVALVGITLILLFIPFLPSVKEAFWGVDLKPTVVTDKQLQDLRDSPDRIWNLLKIKKPKHYREIQQSTLESEYVDTCFCFGSLISGSMDKIWELHVQDNFIIENPLTVAWWLSAANIDIQAQTVSVGKIQAKEVISIKEDIEFHHLQASKILVGDDFSVGTRPYQPVFNRSRKIVSKNMLVVADTTILENLIVHGDLILENNVRIEGSVKVWGNLKVGEQSLIKGDVFVTQNAEFYRGSSVSGVAVIEKKLTTRGENIFGDISHPTTVIAHDISVFGSLLVYGSLKAWHYGEIRTIVDTHLHGC